MWQSYKDHGVQVLVIDVQETKEATQAYAGRWKFSFPVLLDTEGRVAASYAPPGVLPDIPREQVPIASNLIIDREGKIRFFTLLDTASFDAKLVKLTALLEEMLSGPRETARPGQESTLPKVD